MRPQLIKFCSILLLNGCALLPLGAAPPYVTVGRMKKVLVLLALSGCFHKTPRTPEMTRCEVTQQAVNQLREQLKVCQIDKEVIRAECDKQQPK